MEVTEPAPDDDLAAIVGVNVALRCHVASEAEFLSAVEAGIASYKAGPNYDLDTVEAELRRIIHPPA